MYDKKFKLFFQLLNSFVLSFIHSFFFSFFLSFFSFFLLFSFFLFHTLATIVSFTYNLSSPCCNISIIIIYSFVCFFLSFIYSSFFFSPLSSFLTLFLLSLFIFYTFAIIASFIYNLSSPCCNISIKQQNKILQLVQHI